ncbi:MAG: hypothetical protein RL660_1299 [Bacteroidota bacterium]|jgi:hypothetical protein
MQKKYIILGVIVALCTLAIVLASCIKTTQLSSGRCNISADFNGDYTKTFTSNTTASTVTKTIAISLLASNAKPTDIVTFTIQLPLDITPGTYNMKDFSNQPVTFGIVDNNQQIGYGADESGGFTFTITKSDATAIEGTFEGKMLEDGNSGKTCMAANGVFSAKY